MRNRRSFSVRPDKEVFPNGNENFAPSVRSISNRIVATYKLRFAHTSRVNNYHSEISRQFCQVFCIDFSCKQRLYIFLSNYHFKGIRKSKRILYSQDSANSLQVSLPHSCSVDHSSLCITNSDECCKKNSCFALAIPASSRLPFALHSFTVAFRSLFIKDRHHLQSRPAFS